MPDNFSPAQFHAERAEIVLAEAVAARIMGRETEAQERERDAAALMQEARVMRRPFRRVY